MNQKRKRKLTFSLIMKAVLNQSTKIPTLIFQGLSKKCFKCIQECTFEILLRTLLEIFNLFKVMTIYRKKKLRIVILN